MLVADKKKNANRRKIQAIHPPEGHIRVETKVQPSRLLPHQGSGRTGRGRDPADPRHSL